MKASTPLAFALLLIACNGTVNVSQNGGTTSGAGGAGGAGTGGAPSTSSTGDGAGGGELTICGGFAGLTCPAGQYCNIVGCGGDDASGTCMPKPLDCDPGGPPVCGCDGKVYQSACVAYLSGVAVGGTGCTPPTGMFSCGSSFCQVGQTYCAYNLQEPVPMCTPLPASCLPPNAGDCTCLTFCETCSGDPGQLTATCGGG